MSNFFELFNIPVSFHPNQDLVKKTYYELSRTHHPDRLAQNGVSVTDTLQFAANINNAYNTLRNADATMAYILKLHDLMTDEAKYKLPPDFLMEMMDLNELISDLQPNDEKALQAAKTAIEQHLILWEEQVKPLTNKYDAGEQTQEVLLKIKDYYFRKKYLLRINERISKFAAQ